MRRFAGVVLAVVLMATVCAGSIALAIVAFPLADYRPTDRISLPDETVAVVNRTTRRTATASVDLEWSATRQIIVGDAAGKVTAVFATADAPVPCGGPVIAVDGAALLAICGDVPPWRDVRAATKGPDADAVADLLIGLGLLSEADRSNGNRRAASWRALQRFLGQPATGVFRPSDVVWIGDEIAPSRVLVEVGDHVANDTELIEIDAILESATVVDSPGDAFETSSYVFAIEGSPVEFPLSADGELDAGRFEELVKSTMESPDAELPVRVQGSVRLATPISFAGVPPSVLVTAPDGSTCVVLASGGTAPVQVVDSVIGIVMVEADLPEGTLIRNLPPAGTTC